MVACNLTIEDAAVFVHSAPSLFEMVDRFEKFRLLLDLRTVAEIKRFGRACSIPVSCVEVPNEAFDDPTHPLHFLTKRPVSDDE